MWKSIFALYHTDSEAAAATPKLLERGSYDIVPRQVFVGFFYIARLDDIAEDFMSLIAHRQMPSSLPSAA
jgi:hypothetical protein